MSNVIAPDDFFRLGLQPIDLDAANELAALQTRVDRKYIVDAAMVADMVTALSDATRILEIEGLRTFGYRSVYFDTPELDSYLGAAYRRRRRWKVRARSYLDSGVCMLEVKTKNGRGNTVKARLEYDLAADLGLTPEARGLIDEATGRACPSDRLIPTLSTSYQRTTLIDIDVHARVTIDHDLECAAWGALQASIGDRLVVETKSARTPSPADRWLWANGTRPTNVSKFCAGLAALHPELPSNKWHRTLTRDWMVAAA